MADNQSLQPGEDHHTHERNAAIDEAMDNSVAKQSKLAVARDAIFLEQIRDIGANDISNAQRLIEKKVFNGNGSPPPQQSKGDFIVADNMEIHNHIPKPDAPPATPKPALGTAAMIAGAVGLPMLGAALVGAGLLFNRPATPTKADQPAVVAPNGKTTVIDNSKTIRQKAGPFEVIPPKE